MQQSLTTSSLLDKISKLPESRKLIISTSIATIITNEYLTRLSRRALKLVYHYNNYKNVFKSHKKGLLKGIKWVTFVDRDTYMIKPFEEMGVHLRHFNSLPPIDFSVSELEMIARVQHLEHLSQPLTESMYGQNVSPKRYQDYFGSERTSIYNYFMSVFNDLWSNGIDAQ